jgi:hypothetical protein
MKAISRAAEVTKKLILWDPDGDDEVVVRQARGAEQERIEEYLGRFSIRHAGEGVLQDFQWNQAEISFLRVWLTFVSTTLQETYEEESEEKGNVKKETKHRPMFPPGMKEGDFRRKWNGLPTLLRQEWELRVLEVNPHWANLETIADATKN